MVSGNFESAWRGWLKLAQIEDRANAMGLVLSLRARHTRWNLAASETVAWLWTSFEATLTEKEKRTILSLVRPLSIGGSLTAEPQEIPPGLQTGPQQLLLLSTEASNAPAADQALGGTSRAVPPHKGRLPRQVSPEEESDNSPTAPVALSLEGDPISLTEERQKYLWFIHLNCGTQSRHLPVRYAGEDVVLRSRVIGYQREWRASQYIIASCEGVNATFRLSPTALRDLGISSVNQSVQPALGQSP